MSRASRIAVNSLSNYGVTFNAGNIGVFAVQGGWTGIAINSAATLLAFLLALRAELKKPTNSDGETLPVDKEKAQEPPQNIFDDPRTPILAAMVAQLAVAGLTMDSVLDEPGATWGEALTTVTIPLVTAFTNAVAAGALERAAKRIRKVFNRSAELSRPEKIVTSPDLYFAGSSAVSSGTIYTLPAFGFAAVMSLYNKLTGRENTGVLRNPYTFFIAACAISIGANLGSLPVMAGFALYGIGYLSVHGVQRYGGLYEMIKAPKPAIG